MAPRTSRLNDSIQWKHIVAGTVGLFMLLAGFAVWLIGQASAEVADHTSHPQPHPGIEARFDRMETKVDKILELMLADRPRRAPEVPPPAPYRGPRPPR